VAALLKVLGVDADAAFGIPPS
ncbi:MAG: hypothetical protein K0R68_2428, partial [Mycobacterium sp.]|nr:hypothetical protein [Mycobacterium sp.]